MPQAPELVGVVVEQIDHVLLPRDIDIVGKEGEDPADDLGLHIYETSTCICVFHSRCY